MEKFAKKENITSIILTNNYTSTNSLMKISSKLLAVVSCFILLLPTSCQKDELTPDESADVSQQLIEFEGLRVNHTYEVPNEVLNYEEADFQALYLDELSAHNGRTQATLDEASYPTIEVLADVVETQAQKYPDTDALEEEDIKLIKAHFPDLSDKEIDKNLDKIAAYYEKNLQYDVIKSLEKAGSLDTGNGRTQYVYQLCDDEFWVVFGRIKAADAVRDATNDANAYTDELYPNAAQYQDQADAFRHSIWNMLIAKYFAQKKRDKSKGHQLARNFTDAHEDCNRADGNEEYDIQMDMHNNFAGRLYFNRVVSVRRRRGLFRRDEIIAPDNTTIKNDIKAMADNAVQVSKDVNSVNSVNDNELVYF